ncbi:MAG: PDZ domain-containing protein [Acidobacteria bacterium]|nr:PDZ domain-containing protein [Acidobacteriota bacterium]
MSFRGKMWTLLLSAVIAGYVLVGGLPFVGSLLQTQAQQPINDSGAQLRIFGEVLQHIQNDYVDEPNLDKVRLGALRGLVGGLDPYSSYLTADQVKQFNGREATNNVGVGAEFSQVSQYLYVLSVLKGSNAEKAGLKAGDVVEYIENRATRDISLYDAKEMIEGEPGTEVTLRVLRSDSKPLVIKVKRGAHTVPKVETRMETGNVGVIKVFSLEAGEADDIRSQLETLSKKGVEKIVLDLRGVSAGSLDQAVEVANLFIREGDLASITGRDKEISKAFKADPGKHLFDGKVAVLIDFSTAGAAEAVAAAILENKRGEVVGERSFGAGTAQKLFPLRGGDALLLTVERWSSPTGKPFLGDDRDSMGVKPSVEVKRPDTPEPIEVEELIEQKEDEAENPQPSPTPAPSPTPKAPAEDIQLKKALEILNAGSTAAKAAA